MAEQELRDKLELDLLCWREVDRNQGYSDIRARVDHILALIKEAGYMKLISRTAPERAAGFLGDMGI